MAAVRSSLADLIGMQDLVNDSPKVLPLILLLDVSGSMAGGKIEALRTSIREMMSSLTDAPYVRVTVITFGNGVAMPVKSCRPDQIRDFHPEASGATPMGAAISVAKALVEDRDEMRSGDYRPILILASDGHPTDPWEAPLDSFVSSGRSSKCDRLAIPIGADCDHSVLLTFVGGDPAAVVPALRTADIQQAFRLATMSVTSRTRSRTPNNKMALPGSVAVQPSGTPKVGGATTAPTPPGRNSEAIEERGLPSSQGPSGLGAGDSGGSDDDGGNGFW